MFTAMYEVGHVYSSITYWHVYSINITSWSCLLHCYKISHIYSNIRKGGHVNSNVDILTII